MSTFIKDRSFNPYPHLVFENYSSATDEIVNQSKARF
ncbi:hypothetical protein I592_00599 [Enterococcus gilvus ATCC BAA-350]|uniref:Uncharacterized protein n=1 Tax=Enterococcus gilvus ATCC BAA-350 TaxID=1158614 RepID=R2V6U6_9ENTE|nr:hypothetical protein UKC_03363 [Enterococcus gilvus ATCC BAA-350]EOW81314.1 hypothetical protein I592_00599 [Enterococcus gilvus ATCC BAA-350]